MHLLEPGADLYLFYLFIYLPSQLSMNYTIISWSGFIYFCTLSNFFLCVCVYIYMHLSICEPDNFFLKAWDIMIMSKVLESGFFFFFFLLY